MQCPKLSGSWIRSPDGSKCWVHGLEIFFVALLEIILHLRHDQSVYFFISSNLRLGLSTYFHDNISQGVLMNKPDNFDGSRGQLTAGTDTCHLLQIQSPWTWIRDTGQTHSFAAFRTYKEWVPVVLRVPSASTRIFFASYTRIHTSRAHPCAYTGPHRTDPGVLHSW
jgi:hypothetical protein